MHQLLRDEGFWVAFAVALGCSIVIVVVRRPSRFVGLQAGAAAAIGAVVALLDTDRRGMLSFIGLALVVVGAALGRRLPGRWALIAAAPGAAVIALALDATVPDWAAVTLFGAIVVVAPCAIATDVRAPRVLPILLAITAAGMWATTPDTEHTRVLLGAVAGSVVLVLDRRLRAGAGGTAAVVALMAWASVVDGYPSRSAVVGALACFGAVVVLPFLGRARLPILPVPVTVVTGVQIVVAVASRVAGHRSSTVAAVAIAGVALVLAAVVLSTVLGRPSRTIRPPPS